MFLLVAYKCSKIMFAVPSVEINAMTIGERKIVKHKQKWITEEEEALSAGVAKYGQGKWKLILTDPQFSPSFVNRSNIDLKDKWRNMTVNGVGSSSRERVRTPVLEGLDLNTTVNGVGSSSRERVRTPVLEGLDLNMTVGGVGSSSTERVRTPVLEGLDLNMTVSGVGSSSRERVRTPVLGLDLNLPLCSPEPSSVLPLVVYGGTPEPSRSTVDRRAVPDYETMIFEALSTIEDPNGLNVTAILNFIKERYELPQIFRRSVSSKLRRLVLAGELEKVGNRYKYKTSGQEDVIPLNVENINEGENEEDEIGKETPEDAAKVLAYKIAKTEHMEQAAIKSCKKADRLAELLEESMVMLKIAEEIHERCSREGFVVLNL